MVSPFGYFADVRLISKWTISKLMWWMPDGEWIWWLNWRIFPSEHCQWFFAGWSHASSHLLCAGIIPVGVLPPVSQTNTHIQRLNTWRGWRCTHMIYMRSDSKRWRHMHRRVHAVAFKLVLCLRGHALIFPIPPHSTPLSIQLLPLSISFCLCHKPFSATS